MILIVGNKDSTEHEITLRIIAAYLDGLGQRKWAQCLLHRDYVIYSPGTFQATTIEDAERECPEEVELVIALALYGCDRVPSMQELDDDRSQELLSAKHALIMQECMSRKIPFVCWGELPVEYHAARFGAEQTTIHEMMLRIYEP
jgi:hypothetical protein